MVFNNFYETLPYRKKTDFNNNVALQSGCNKKKRN